MRLENYDKALKTKLESVFPNVVFSPMGKVFETEAKTDGKSQEFDGENRVKSPKDQIVSVPMIAFDRINNGLNFEFGANDSVVRRGRYVVREEDDVREKALPVNLFYQIDIISDKRVEVDGIWRELVMYLYTHPIVHVEFLYKEEILYEDIPIRLMDTDNTTDVEEFSDKGRIYRQTLNIELPQARLLFIEKVDLVEEIPIRVLQLGEDDD